MAGDLEHVFGGVRSRGGEQVTITSSITSAIFIVQLARTMRDAASVRSVDATSMLSDDLRLAAGKPHDAEAAASGGSGNRRYRVVEAAGLAPAASGRPAAARPTVAAGAPLGPPVRVCRPRRQGRAKIHNECGAASGGRSGIEAMPGGINHDAPLGTGAGALAAHFMFVAQSDVNHSAFAAVHGIEAEHSAGPFHFFRGRRALTLSSSMRSAR